MRISANEFKFRTKLTQSLCCSNRKMYDHDVIWRRFAGSDFHGCSSEVLSVLPSVEYDRVATIIVSAVPAESVDDAICEFNWAFLLKTREPV